MAYISIALLLVLGFLGAIQLIAAKKPEAKGLADKLAPYQGWIGAAGLLFGAAYLLRMLFGGWFTALSYFPVLALTSLAASLLLIALGALFGVALLKQFGGEEKAKKVEPLLMKLRPMQGTLGLAAMGVGAWFLVQNLFHIAL